MPRRLLLLCVLVGCAARSSGGGSAVPDPRLDEVDRRWDMRGQDGFEPVADLLQGPEGSVESVDPEWLWRRVRLEVGRGLESEGDRRVAMQHYASARALGLRCLDGAPAFRQQRGERGLADAARVLPPTRVGCAAWTALAWARWAALFGGEAAAMDLPGIEALAAYSVSNSSGSIRSTGAWAEAIAVACQPDWVAEDPERATRLMQRAVELAPEQLMRQWDLVWLVAAPLGYADLESTTLEKLLESSPRTPADRTAFGMASLKE